MRYVGSPGSIDIPRGGAVMVLVTLEAREGGGERALAGVRRAVGATPGSRVALRNGSPARLDSNVKVGATGCTAWRGGGRRGKGSGGVKGMGREGAGKCSCEEGRAAHGNARRAESSRRRGCGFSLS